MATNGTEIAAELGLDAEILRLSKTDHSQPAASLDRTHSRKRVLDYRVSEAEPVRSANEPVEEDETFALAPLVNKIAFSMARGLVVALKELEDHIASETRKVGDTVDRRLDTLQTTLQELSNFMGAQRSTNAAVESRLQDLGTAIEKNGDRQAADVETLRNEAREFSATVTKQFDLSAASVQAAEARQAANVDGLRVETKELLGSVSQRIEAAVASQEECNARQSAALTALSEENKAFSLLISEKVDNIFRELGVHQEDISAMKGTLCTFSNRVQGLVERLDRQADTVRSMCSAYSQRETELEQLVDSLARLRSFPTPLPTNGL